IFVTFALIHPSTREYYIDPWTGKAFGSGGVDSTTSAKNGDHGHAPPNVEVLTGGVIMPELGNATAKALLGQATWKLMHTMTLRFPETPSQDERDALRSYFYLTSRLYPCGECAKHFQQLLKDYPPQTSSRKTASFWLCHIHNLVNTQLSKPEFDCTKLDEAYDCGCGPEGTPSKKDAFKGEPMTQDGVTGVDMIKGGIGS
ncbi:hypothetical protein BS47DRAFT_1295112, partial [Hydnum rufescens UP504]